MEGKVYPGHRPAGAHTDHAQREIAMIEPQAPLQGFNSGIGRCQGRELEDIRLDRPAPGNQAANFIEGWALLKIMAGSDEVNMRGVGKSAVFQPCLVVSA